MKRCIVALLACVVTGCGKNAVQPVQKLHVLPVGGLHPKTQQVRKEVGESLSVNLGWVEYDRSWLATYPNGDEVLMIPLEAEDEVRIIAVWHGAVPRVIALGFSAAADFTGQHEPVDFEGWVFCYDLKEGRRSITSYFESGALTVHLVEQPQEALQKDVLSRDFPCFTEQSKYLPVHVSTRLFTAEWDQRMYMLALHVYDMGQCFAP